MASPRKSPPDFGRILTGEEGFAFDVAVPFDPARYGSRTIMRMVKQANRRGRVRYCAQRKDGKEYRFCAGRDDIKDVDDLTAFVRDLVDRAPLTGPYAVAAKLIVSFEDLSDARTFARDLERLTITQEAREAFNAVVAQRRADDQALIEGADRARPKQFPPPLTFRDAKRHREWKCERWNIFAGRLNAAEIGAWFTAHIQRRYWIAVWNDGEQPTMHKWSWRYWRLRPEEWRELIAVSDGNLYACFEQEADYDRFDARYGPGRIVYMAESPRLMAEG